MSAPDRTTDRISAGARQLPVAAVLAVAAGTAIVIDSIIAAVAIRAGAGSDWPPLMLPLHGAFAAIGVVVGWLGWSRFVRQTDRSPRSTAILVGTVLAASFVPDVALLVFRFIPGTTTVGVLALMTMHLVVAGVALPGYTVASRR